MRILVTGGLGYIGSHVVMELSDRGHEIVISDVLNENTEKVLNALRGLVEQPLQFIDGNIGSLGTLMRIFNDNPYDSIIHLAAYTSIPESFDKRVEYYFNNYLTTADLAKRAIEHGCYNFVFSSTAALYKPSDEPVEPHDTLIPKTSPYAFSKYSAERVLEYISGPTGFNTTTVRLFNPVGTHTSGLLPKGNGIYASLKWCEEEKIPFTIYGNDYVTHDGTAIRDYVHIDDVADAFSQAALKQPQGYHCVNLCRGIGLSVAEFAGMFDVEVKYGKRRGRENPTSIGNPEGCKQLLDWDSFTAVNPTTL